MASVKAEAEPSEDVGWRQTRLNFQMPRPLNVRGVKDVTRGEGDLVRPQSPLSPRSLRSRLIPPSLVRPLTALQCTPPPLQRSTNSA